MLGVIIIFFLSAGFCAGSSVLPPGPVDVVAGKSVTLKVLVAKNTDDIIIWNFSDGKDQTNVGTLRSNTSQLNDPYKDRAAIDPSNGFLTLNALQNEDSGDYSINILKYSGTTLTGEIKVRVLGKSFGYTDL